ncbi:MULTISPECIES: bifunctional biotin--[acetyl-CoA-carboxylase] ligase/biotin operon repressor BirA [Salinivibrio]|uniref:Bifunctional ligase/repressor BirA n=2 Tax=Salinivibrio TaxID=51366 RepID=A0ABY7LBM0_9GAMM|nr:MULTISPECIES: bifunctional biotin--[acetyl-CoA-carboxylase] ligase/biotin operon repressor BirA [Salinivibrio]PCE68317.1 biotin--[acetyl-CoA-carboxylase] ligase [Salinivibrio sp. YCSC6]QCF34798.1 bifunctional biotin--[acetyl-CoA-carboxylase] ligase/biotin operon repressor BirA [Salinivibrio sp. YCSC6]QIR07142.1 bifunctional biotin--[acetyl-CoA-carboxylase] ligase/biotin operon repressor BirA [Salinivibrio costicola]WBA14628.1 bifunctional biotin--[acetyl-CoA-carboxylase] ligase/biotin operon
MSRTHSARLALIGRLSDGEFHSGEMLGDALGMSRAAISKHIKVLQSWGLDIYRVQGKGYCLSQPIELLDEAWLSDHTDVPALSVIPVIDSTNQHLMERVGQLTSGSVCLAEYQQQGRGRRGRVWQSPFGSNLYLSMYWRLDAGPAAAMGLSLVVGVAMTKALHELGAPGVKVKWPNDLYYQDKKLAGILVEMTGQTGDAAHLVIGMGLNIGMGPHVSEHIDQPWARLADACQPMPSRNVLASVLISRLQDALLDYEKTGLAGIMDDWQQLDNFKGRPVKLLMGDREVRGIERGIDEHGALLLDVDGVITPYLGGEISLRRDD